MVDLAQEMREASMRPGTSDRWKSARPEIVHDPGDAESTAQIISL